MHVAGIKRVSDWARSVVASGNRDAALAFFPERVAITEKPLIEALLRH